MTFTEIVNASEEIKDLLRPKICPDVDRLQYLKDKYGDIRLIEKLFNDDYDRRVTRPGWGSQNCSCHISPPCQNCVDFTNSMTEEELEEHLKSLK